MPGALPVPPRSSQGGLTAGWTRETKGSGRRLCPALSVSLGLDLAAFRRRPSDHDKDMTVSVAPNTSDSIRSRGNPHYAAVGTDVIAQALPPGDRWVIVLREGETDESVIAHEIAHARHPSCVIGRAGAEEDCYQEGRDRRLARRHRRNRRRCRGLADCRCVARDPASSCGRRRAPSRFSQPALRDRQRARAGRSPGASTWHHGRLDDRCARGLRSRRGAHHSAPSPRRIEAVPRKAGMAPFGWPDDPDATAGCRRPRRKLARSESSTCGIRAGQAPLPGPFDVRPLDLDRVFA